MYKISVTNEYISPKEAAERLAVSTGTVRRLMKGGELAGTADFNCLTVKNDYDKIFERTIIRDFLIKE